MSKVLIIGATSAIAIACAREWAKEGTAFFLVGRNARDLDDVRADLAARGATAQTHVLDFAATETYPAVFEQCFAALGRVDIALIAHGSLPDQKQCEADADIAMREFMLNAGSVIRLLTLLAARMEPQKSGAIAVLSSVAGDRGRPTNYLYGSAKAAVTTFCDGLRAQLFKSGIHVLTVKPGFVDTPMTRGLPIPGILLAQPRTVARDILAALKSRKGVLYTPFFWRPIMWIIRMIPDGVFKKLNL